MILKLLVAAVLLLQIQIIFAEKYLLKLPGIPEPAFYEKFNIRYITNEYFLMCVLYDELKTCPVDYTILDILPPEQEYFLILIPKEAQLEHIKRNNKITIVLYDAYTVLIRTDYTTAEELMEKFKVKPLPERIYLPEISPYQEKYSIFATEQDEFAIQNLMNKLSPSQIQQYIQELQNFQTRYTYSDKCDLVKNYLIDKFTAFGFSVTTHSYLIRNHRKYNVIAKLTGQTSPEKVYIMCAHYDSISPEPYNLAPGADDNASGCAALLATASAIYNTSQKFHSTIWFVAFSGEEQGLVGSRNFVKDLFNNTQRIIAVLNLDMIGYYKEGLPYDLDVITNIHSNWLVEYLLHTNNKFVNMPVRYHINNGAWWSDHSSFWDYGYYAIDLIEAYDWYSVDFNPYYHTTDDTVDKLNITFATKIACVGLTLLCQLANPLTEPQDIAVIEPDGVDDVVVPGQTYTIRWVNNTNSYISLYYDTDTDGEGGTFIGMFNSATHMYNWSTFPTSPGRYYVYISTQPGLYKCSPGPITVFSAKPVVKVYPNPFSPARGDYQVVFYGIAPNSEIKIYTISGEIVKTAFVKDKIEWSWTGKNNSGEDVSSGLYLFSVTDTQGGESSIGKLAVIR